MTKKNPESHQMGKSENKRMESKKNGVACTIARVIQMKNVFSKGVVVNVGIVLLLMVGIAKNMKRTFKGKSECT